MPRRASPPPKSTTVQGVKRAAQAMLSRRQDAEQQVHTLRRQLELHQRADQVRADRWVNYATGLGTADDKTRSAHFEFPWRLSDTEITALASGNALAAKIIEKRPKEMFRRGYTLEAVQSGGDQGDGKKGGAGADKSQLEDLVDYAGKRKLDQRTLQTMIFGRQYGGSLMLMGIDDGREVSEPVDEKNIRSVRFFNQIDRRFSYVTSYYSDFDEPNFGEPEAYLVANGVATSSYRSADGSSFGYKKYAPQTIASRNASSRKSMGAGTAIQTVHESRVIRFDGVLPDQITQQTLAGWSWSILQRIYEVMRLCDSSLEALAYLVSDASQGVIKLKGLFNAITSGNEKALSGRLEQLEKTRSVARMLALDANGGEEFTRVATPMAGIPDAVDRLMQYLAAAADMPLEELFGHSPGGLASAGAGESSRIQWYSTIANEQANDLGPSMARAYRYCALAKDSPFKGKDVSFKLNFRSLYSPTDSELAKTRASNATRDAAYVAAEIVTPEEVRLTISDIYPSIDPEELEQEIEAKTKFDPYENDPNASDQAQADKQAQAAKENLAVQKAGVEAKAKAAAGSGPVPGLREGGGGESPTPAVPQSGNAAGAPAGTPADKDADARGDAGPGAAAIVIVRDPRGFVLTVTRPEPPHEFSIPGGTIDPGETPEQAAARELLEECAIRVVGLDLARIDVTPLGAPLYVFTASGFEGEPRAAEEGTEIAWLTPGELLAQADLLGDSVESFLRAGLLRRDEKLEARLLAARGRRRGEVS